MSYADEIRALLAKKEAIKRQKQFGYYGPPSNASPVPWISQEDWEKATRELEAASGKKAAPGQVPIAAPPGSVAAIANPQKKAGWGWAFLLVGGGIFVFWGIPLLQGKGAYKPGMSKPPPGYTPTRNSPGEE